MPWFAANAIMYFKWKDAPQPRVIVWDNVILIEAPDADRAWELAEKAAREQEGDTNGTLRDDGHPATLVFAGIRQLLDVDPWAEDERLGSGDEIGFSWLRLPTIEAVEALAAGKEVTVTMWSGPEPPKQKPEGR